MNDRFDLEKSLAAWRRSLEHNDAFLPDDRDELEQHVRDEVAALTRQGVQAEDAFRRAMEAMGGYGAVEAEYRKVYWGKRRRRREWRHEVTGRLAMLQNYLKIAYRSLSRHRGYAFVNVAGLAVGMACCLLILLFVRDELSYDRSHPNAARTYRIVSDWTDFAAPVSNPPFVRALKTAHPEVTVALLKQSQGLVRYEDRIFEEKLLFGSASVFDVFALPLAATAPQTALERPYTAIITEQIARKYFGREDPIGKRLQIDYEMELEVTGVTAGMPANAHFHFDILASWATLDALAGYSDANDWSDNSLYAYLSFPEGSDPKALEAAFPDLIARHAGAQWNGSKLSLQPLTDIHLRSHLDRELEPNGDIAYVYLFSVIAVFILVIACINFTNLATARSMERAKEVGVRKALGARRGQLVQQFLAESVLLSAGALVLALGLTAAALPGFRALAGRAMPVDVLGDGFVVLAFLAITMGAGLLAGSYPALVLSGFNPVAVLKGRLRSNSRGAALRKGLVVFQFATTVVLMVSTFVVYHQLDYLRAARLGFDQEQVLVVPFQDGSLRQQYPAFKQALLQQSNMLSVSIASESFPSDLLRGLPTVLGSTPVEAFRQRQFVPTRIVSVGHDFFETIGARMIHGRSFSPDFPADSGAYVLNETAARMLRETFPDQIASVEAEVGMEIALLFDRGPLLGIVSDFNMATLHQAIEPIIFVLDPDQHDTFLIRVAPGDYAGAVDVVGSVWERFYPGWPFTFSFADQGFDARYQSEERLGMLFTLFSLLAVGIACLGLFGLAAFTTRQRTKEIGIRKVLGASAAGILMLFWRDVARLVGVGFVLAVPVAHLAAERWLEDFAYHVDLGPEVFLLAGGLVAAVALLTVSYQSVKAALADPVRSLRYE